MQVDKSFYWMQVQLGIMFGQPCAIQRPDYTQIDGTPATIVPSIRIKVEPTNAKLTQARFLNADYYAVFGNRALFQPGDLIVPLGPMSNTPPVTIVSYSPNEECTGIRSQRVGSIYQNMDYPAVYTSVRFDFVGEGFPGSSLEQNLSGALSIPTKKAVLWARPNLRPEDNTSDIVGMRLVEEDGSNPIAWIIKQIDLIGPLAFLTLEEEGARTR